MKMSNKKRKIIVSLIIFVTTYLLLLAFKNFSNFTDEADNMLAAMKIANGGDIYLDYYAHHMPLMYYLLTPFALLGVGSTYAFRICFYGILSLIWALMYYHYSDKINSKVLFFYPYIYVFIMTLNVNYSVVSEHLQAQALVVLLLELVQYCKNKELSLTSEIIISCCIFTSIFSVFSSIVSVGILALIVMIIEIRNYFKIHDNKKDNIFLYILKKYKRLIIIVLIPFALILLFYAFNGSLKQFYRQAFYFNVNVYSNYQSYPSNPILIILYTLKDFVIALKYFISNILSSFRLIYLLPFILIVGTIIYLIKSKDENKFYYFIYVFFLGNRSFLDFHALAYFAGAIILTLILLTELDKKYFYIFPIIMSVAYLPNIGRILQPLNDIKSITSNYDYVTVKKITERENDVYYLNLQIQDYVNTNRLPATRAMTIFPWFQDMFEEELLDDLKKNKPSVIAYEPTANVWGYVYQDYLELIDPWIRENYTYTNEIKIGSNQSVWIRNDYVSTVEKKLGLDIADYTNNYGDIIELPASKKIVSNISFTKDYVKKSEIKFNTYNRMNTSNVKVALLDDNGKEIFATHISAIDLKSETFYPIEIDKEVKANHNYTLEIINEDYFYNNYVGVYGTTLKNDTNDNYVKFNENKSEYEINMNVYY